MNHEEQQPIKFHDLYFVVYGYRRFSELFKCIYITLLSSLILILDMDSIAAFETSILFYFTLFLFH